MRGLTRRAHVRLRCCRRCSAKGAGAGPASEPSARSALQWRPARRETVGPAEFDELGARVSLMLLLTGPFVFWLESRTLAGCAEDSRFALSQRTPSSSESLPV